MRKNSDFNDKVIEDLGKRLENLTTISKQQEKVIEDFTKQIDRLSKEVNFLKRNDRNSVYVYWDLAFKSDSFTVQYKATYIYDNKLFDVVFYETKYAANLNVVDNNKDYVIIKAEDFVTTYYKLDKAKGIAVDITAEYTKIIESRKQNGDKEEQSAEVLEDKTEEVKGKGNK